MASAAELVYLDDALIVVNKPAGLLAVPGREKTTNGTPGSFHAAAAACFTGG